MKMQKTTIRSSVVIALCILIPSALVQGVCLAESQLNLPSTSAYIEVTNGNSSYFVTNLTGVPTGYDVGNGSYLGWCVDVRAYMTRAPATHEVRLFSSLNPPEELANNSWDMVNYILNHKQGNATDIQQAIWYFVHMGGNYTPTTTTAWSIINDTLVNGKGFSPMTGQTEAVICYPLIYSHQPDVQISIIETADPTSSVPEFSSILVLSLLLMPALLAAALYAKKTRKRPNTDTRQAIALS